MSQIPVAVANWLRPRLTGLNRLAWPERAGFAVLAVAGAAAVWFADRLTTGPRLALGLLFLLTLAVLLRRGWVTLLGPIALYELVHVTRRSHFVLYRLYAYFVLIALALSYCVWALAKPSDDPAMHVPAREVASFAAGFIFTFLGLQMLLLAVLTPVYTAGTLAEEKGRGTLEFLLATDLSGREIVLSKLAARLGNLLLTLLAGLPVLVLLQALGGVDLLPVLIGFAATAAMVVGLAGLGVLNSVYARTPQTAIVLTLMEGAAYLVFAYVVPQLIIGAGYLATPVPGLGGFTVGAALAWLDAGNPLSLLFDLAYGAATGTPVAVSLAERFGEYVAFHGLLALVCVTWASARLRAVFRKQVYEQALPGESRRRRWWHPRVGRSPVVWKEVFAPSGLRFRRFGRVVVGVLVVGSFFPIWLVVAGPGPPRLHFFALWSRGIGAVVACLLLLRVAVHAATALTGERERQTLDGIVVTPLGAGEILFGKWLGSVASVRWGWLWLGTIWAVGVWMGQLHERALLLMLAAWWVYAAVLAVVGLWFSLSQRSSTRATALTLVVAFGLGFSYALTWPALVLTPNWYDPGWLLTFLTRFQAGLSPLLSLAWLLAFDADGRFHDAGWELHMGLAGLACWAVGGGVLWCVLLRRFRSRTGRLAVSRPEREPPAEPGRVALDIRPVATEL